jgi:Ca2+-binding EF-hand superfamily protein
VIQEDINRFNELDQDRTGFIDMKDLMANKKCANMTRDQLMGIMAQADGNRDGRISLEEYMNVLRSQPGSALATL